MTDALSSRFPTRIHRLDIGDPPNATTIDLLAPTDPDALLDDPVVEQRYKADNYLPYWPIIWPSGLMLAQRILAGEPAPPASADRRAVDLGCGLGTTGIAAAKKGWHVTFTDYDPEAVQFAAHNAARNGVAPELIRAVHMDWRAPLAESFDWVLASDVLYERRLHVLLLSAVEALLSRTNPAAQAWVSDPQRTSAEDFPIAAATAGFRCTAVPMVGKSFSGGAQPGTLYVLSRPAR